MMEGQFGWLILFPARQFSHHLEYAYVSELHSVITDVIRQLNLIILSGVIQTNSSILVFAVTPTLCNMGQPCNFYQEIL